MLKKGANVSRLTWVWAQRGMRPRGWSDECAREGGVTSVIADVNGAAAKMTMTGVVTIGRDTITVVSTRETVAGQGSNAGGARSRAWPCNKERDRGFARTQAERGGGGTKECEQQMQDAKKVERTPTTLIVKDGKTESRSEVMSTGGNWLMEEGGGQRKNVLTLEFKN